MLAELRAAPLLRGYRGASPADEAALRDVVLRVSALLTICPKIQEPDLNPVIVLAQGPVRPTCASASSASRPIASRDGFSIDAAPLLLAGDYRSTLKRRPNTSAW